jgi:LCP family protein required for cell wall assembly
MVLAGCLAVLMVLGGLIYLKLSSNITTIDVSSLGKRPVNPPDPVTNLSPMNILVIGSDTRDLATGKFGSKKDLPGARPDTTLIVHLSGDRKSAVVVSIPRDSMTHAARDCKDPNSVVMDGPIQMWNSNQGAACVWRAVEGNTGIVIDHSLVLDFDGFQKMVDALGSVEVCTPTPINDPRSGLVLKAGRTRVKGPQALAFVRARYTLGDGSDIGRIPRQQAFLSAMVQEATSKKLFLQPVKLLRFLDAVTNAVAMDPGLKEIGARIDLAQSVVGLKSSQIRFVTVPNEPYPTNHNRVQWTPDADALWKSIIHDAPLPGSTPPPASNPGPTPTPTPTATPVPLTVRPDKITVHIVNASGVSGLGRRAATDLLTQGFNTTPSSTGTNLSRGVIVGYSSKKLQSARTVAAAFPGATLVQDESAGDFIRVNLGAGSPNVVKVPNRLGTSPPPTDNGASATPTPTVTIKARTADSNLCKA